MNSKHNAIIKYDAANVLKSLLGNDERFGDVGGKIDSTRSAIQQTELAHLTPPSPKQKARFRNLASKIRWLTMIIWLLKHPDATAQEGISDERLQEKLGWIEQYEDDIYQPSLMPLDSLNKCLSGCVGVRITMADRPLSTGHGIFGTQRRVFKTVFGHALLHTSLVVRNGDAAAP